MNQTEMDMKERKDRVEKVVSGNIDPFKVVMNVIKSFRIFPMPFTMKHKDLHESIDRKLTNLLERKDV